MRRHSDEEVAALYARYTAGETLKQIAHSIGWSRWSLSRLFVAHGYRLHDYREAQMRRALPDPYVLALYHRYQQGESLAAIAATRGMSAVRLLTLFRTRGLPLRTRSEAQRLRHRRERERVE